MNFCFEVFLPRTLLCEPAKQDCTDTWIQRPILSSLPMSYVKGTSSCFLALKSCISCFQVPAVRYCKEQSSFYQASAVLIQICADQYYLCLIFGDALSLAKRQSIAEDQASVVLIRTNLNQYRRRSVE